MSKLNLNVLRWIFRAWRYRLVIEKHEIQFMLNHLKLGYTAIDIGAHKGAYTYWMSKYVGKEGRVFSFEPQPELHNQLVSLIKHSNNKNIYLEASALSSTKGKDTMKIPGGGTSPSASIINKKSQNISETISIKKTTLDDYFCKKNQIPVNFIKCDAEGHELEVLKGGEQLLRKFHPIISLESEARHCGIDNVMSVFNFLNKLDYKGFFVDGGSMLSLDNFNIEKHQLNNDEKNYVNNFFFIPKQ